MKKIIYVIGIAIFLVLGIVLVRGDIITPAPSPKNDAKIIEQGYGFDRIENPDGTKILTLYSGVRNVYEDNTWKRVENARSLINQPFHIVYLKDDPNYVVTVNDFNLTWIDLRLKTTADAELGKAIPIKVDDSSLDTVILNSKDEQANYKINNVNVMEKNFTFGSASTTIMLQDNETENLEDTYIQQNDANTNKGTLTAMGIRYSSSGSLQYSYIKFNITSIPIGKNIDDAHVYINVNGQIFGCQGPETLNISVNEVHNQTWVETGPTWNNPIIDEVGTTRNIINWTNYTSANGWKPFNITSWVRDSYESNLKNLSIEFKSTDASGNGCGVQFGSRNGGRGGSPYLNITYSDIPIPLIKSSVASIKDSKLIIKSGRLIIK